MSQKNEITKANQKIMEKMKSLIYQAKKENKWLYNHVNGEWIPPDEFEAMIATNNVRLLFTYQLKVPNERLFELEQNICEAQQKLKTFKLKLKKWKIAVSQ